MAANPKIICSGSEATNIFNLRAHSKMKQFLKKNIIMYLLKNRDEKNTVNIHVNPYINQKMLYFMRKLAFYT